MIQLYNNEKSIPTKKMIGHATDDDIDIQFEFEVPSTADEDDIISKMTETFLEKFQMFFEECEENE